MSDPAAPCPALGRDLTAEELRIVEHAAEFADQAVAPSSSAWEAGTKSAAPTLRQAAGLGLLGLLVPREQGGLGLRPGVMAAVAETMAARDFFFTFALMVHNNLAAAVAAHGTESQHNRYLPALISGERIGAFLLTEPGAGSDAGAIATEAQPAADGWRLNGRKGWVSNACHAGLLSVYARVGSAAGTSAIGAFLVEPDSPGAILENPLTLPAARALGVAEFRFADCHLDAAGQFLTPGQGFRTAMAGIDLARVMVAAMCCGMVADALRRACGYAAERRAFGAAIADHQGLVWQLADVATALAAARALTRKAARQLDTGEPATLATAHAKKFATRMALQAIADCMQAHGAAALGSDQPFLRQLTAAKTAQYLDGTTEIQNVVIARALRDPGAALL